MLLLIVAVGQHVPDWAQVALDDYAKRFPYEIKVELKTVKTEPRCSKTVQALVAAERIRIEAALPKGCRIVALDERGTTLTTLALAAKLQNWQLESDDVALVSLESMPLPGQYLAHDGAEGWVLHRHAGVLDSGNNSAARTATFAVRGDLGAALRGTGGAGMPYVASKLALQPLDAPVGQPS